jgi:hypothetical protein
VLPKAMQRESSQVAASARHGNHSAESGGRVLDSKLPLPNFFIVGAAKAGTTSLHAYLKQHPDVFMSQRKEPHYFATFEMRPEFDNFTRPIRDSVSYQNLFLGSEGFKAVGEASPSYLCDKNAATLIKSAVPNAKIIISLRNPVQRAYSHYLMEYRAGRERLPFAEALEKDQRRSEKGWGTSFEYIELGLYAGQVERFLSCFGQRNVLVILFEELVQDTTTVMNEVAGFLGIDPARFPPSTFEQAHNSFEASRGALARALLRCRPVRIWSKRLVPQQMRDAAKRLLFVRAEKPRLDDEIQQSLAERFDSDIEQLERLLRRDLSALRRN